MTAAVKPTLAILVAISALQPIALNLLAPATPALARHFTTNYATIQLTLTLFLVAVAVTQLIIGPLSDRFGRRPCVNAGVALFVLGSVLGAFAPSTHILLIARVLEGAGGGAVFALSRATPPTVTMPPARSPPSPWSWWWRRCSRPGSAGRSRPHSAGARSSGS